MNDDKRYAAMNRTYAVGVMVTRMMDSPEWEYVPETIKEIARKTHQEYVQEYLKVLGGK